MPEYYPGSGQDYPPEAQPPQPGIYPPSPSPVPDYQPPGYAPQDPRDYVGPPEYNPVTPLPRNIPSPDYKYSPSPGPPVYTDMSWYGAAAGMANPFFRVVRRVRKTRLTRFLEGEAKIGLEALKGWYQGSSTLASTVRIGTEGAIFPSLGTALARTGIGVLVTSLLFPDSVNEKDSFPLELGTRGPRLGFFGRAERGPEPGSLADPIFAARVKNMVYVDQFTRSRRVPSAAVQELGNRLPDVILSTRPPNLVERLQELSDDTGFTNIGRLLNPAGWTPFRMPGGKVVGTAPGFNDYVPPAPPQLATPANLGVGPVPSTPGSQNVTPSSSSSSKGARSPKGLAFPNVGLGALIGIGAGAVIGTRYLIPAIFGRSPYGASQTFGGGSQTQPPSSILPTTGPSTVPNVLVGSFGPGLGSGAYCEPVPRGPRRKCLERAPVSWRSGRNKGKAAGSKCLRYASRKT